MNLSSRQAWTLGGGGVLGVLLIAVGLAWDAPARECLNAKGPWNSRVCLEYGPDLSWAPPLLVLLGIACIVVAGVGAFTSSRRAGVLTLGGAAAFILIGMGLAWDGPVGDITYGSIMEGRPPTASTFPKQGLDAGMAWLPPTLLTAGIIVAIITVALALSPWGRGKA